jgi:hypothetical protein
MSATSRMAVAIPLGIFTGVLTTAIAGRISYRIWPVPAAFDMGDRLAVQAHVDGLPATALMLMLTGWVCALGTSAAAAIMVARSHHRSLALVMDAMSLVIALETFSTVTHPGWFVALSLAVLVACTACLSHVAGHLEAAGTAQPAV